MRKRPSIHRNSVNGNGKRPPGRPRSEEARLAILSASLKLLANTGFSDFTI
jgi:hypothetical protein